MPKDVQLSSAQKLTNLNLQLLKEMQQKAEVLTKDLNPKAKFKYATLYNIFKCFLLIPKFIVISCVINNILI